MKASLSIYSPGGSDPFSNYSTAPKAAKVRLLIKLLTSLIGGGILSRAANRPTILAGTAYATAIVTCASVSAADTVTINGQDITAVSGTPAVEQFDISGANAADATSLAAGINASAQTLIANLVKAGNLAGTVTCASAAAGDTVTIAGVTLTAVAAASGKADEFSISGNDTADATALTSAINAHPALKELVVATSSSAVVTVRQLPFLGTTALVLASSHATRLAVVAIAATAVVLLVAANKGLGGNCFTIATSNGTRLAIGGSATRLSGGTASTLTF